jgi:hypothetical protein
MPTECSPGLSGFARIEGYAVAAGFDGGAITSDRRGIEGRCPPVDDEAARSPSVCARRPERLGRAAAEGRLSGSKLTSLSLERS